MERLASGYRINWAAELCVQAANDTNTTEDRSKIAAEITQIYDETDRVFETTEFNTMKIFRHDKSGLDYPKEFTHTDDDGNTNVIRNYMVELKNVTNGSQIAADIVSQLKDDLDHFTEVTVSDTNPSVLIAQDKRSKDQNGRGQIMAGVYTNFIFNVRIFLYKI